MLIFSISSLVKDSFFPPDQRVDAVVVIAGFATPEDMRAFASSWCVSCKATGCGLIDVGTADASEVFLLGFRSESPKGQSVMTKQM